MYVSSYLSQDQLVILEHLPNKLFPLGFLRKDQLFCRILRSTSNCVHWPYLIPVISSESIFHTLRTQSTSYFDERGGLIEKEDYLQFELEKGALL